MFLKMFSILRKMHNVNDLWCSIAEKQYSSLFYELCNSNAVNKSSLIGTSYALYLYHPMLQRLPLHKMLNLENFNEFCCYFNDKIVKV